MNVRPLLYTLATLGAGVSGFAQKWWDGSSNGNWATGANWSPSGVPGATSTNYFYALGANSQWVINLGSTRTMSGVVFTNSPGSQGFTFNAGQFNIGSAGIINNDADTQTFNSNLQLTANQTWNSAAGDLLINGITDLNTRVLTIAGPGDVNFVGNVTGSSGSLIKQGSGTMTLSGSGTSFNGGFYVQGGLGLVSIPGSYSIIGTIAASGGGIAQFSPTGDFGGFQGPVNITNGTVRLNAGNNITQILSGGSITFGTSGGLLDIASRLNNGVSLGSVTVNSLAATPAIIQYGTIANSSSSPFGWDTGGRSLTVANGNLLGTDALEFALNNGAMIEYNQANFGGSLNFTGVSGGNAAAGSAATTVGRLLLDSQAAFTVAGDISFDNAMQVTVNGAGRTLDSDLTINSGTTAFQGQSKNAAAPGALTLGAVVGGRTLTIKDGATASMDVRFRDDSANNFIGGVTLNANSVIEAGGQLQFVKSATVAGESVSSITVNGDITGQGTTAKESLMTLRVGSGTGGVNFGAGSNIIVNGSGLGGLRVTGTKAQVDNFLTAGRLGNLTGTGGTMTVAYTDSSTGLFAVDPTVGSNVRLGFDTGGLAPTYQLGSAANDLANWGGLVVKGGTVRQMVDQSFAGSAGATSLDLTGGNLILNSGASARTMTFEGGANLTGGNLNSGTLVLGSSVVFGPSITFSNAPNITINNSGPATISGTAVAGLGTVTKQGAGTLTVNSGVSANVIDIRAGTLLLGSNNLIGDSTSIRMGGGTLATGGFDDTVGTMTLAANSTIDLGSGSSILHFGNSSGIAWTNSTILTIANYNGGSDQIFFGSTIGGLTGSQVSQIRFVNPNGVLGTFNAMILASGEIVPVPEPATIAFGALLLGSLGYRDRHRLASLLARLRALFQH